MAKRRRRDEPGRLKWKIAELLEAFGFIVSPYDILAAQGYHRIGKYEEAYRWEAWGRSGTGVVPRGGHVPSEPKEPITFIDETVPVHFCSWDTMTECVKRGVEIYQEHPSDLASQIAVSAKE